MRQIRLEWLGWMLVCAAGAVLPADACRYNVRDVGFVDFDSSRYRLYVFVDGTVPPARTAAIEKTASTVLKESNIVLEIVDIVKDHDHLALDYLPANSSPTLPCAVLVSPEGRSLPVALMDALSSGDESIPARLEAVTASPVRDRIRTAALRAYGVILLVEGTDGEENRRVLQCAREVIQRIWQTKDLLPKPIENPPELLVLKQDDLLQEAILVWSLGIHPADTRVPQAAVLYGRGRRIGPILTGETITPAALGGIVSVIGLSCECGLDRSWLLGTMIPGRWPRSYRNELVERLGFDPDNPLVKTEISQILSLGSAAGQRWHAGIGWTPPVLTGYEEVTRIESPDDSFAGLVAGDHALVPPGRGESYSNIGNAVRENHVRERGSSPWRLVVWIMGGLIGLSLAGGLVIILYARGKAV